MNHNSSQKQTAVVKKHLKCSGENHQELLNKFILEPIRRFSSTDSTQGTTGHTGASINSVLIVKLIDSIIEFSTNTIHKDLN